MIDVSRFATPEKKREEEIEELQGGEGVRRCPAHAAFRTDHWGCSVIGVMFFDHRKFQNRFASIKTVIVLAGTRVTVTV